VRIQPAQQNYGYGYNSQSYTDDMVSQYGYHRY